MTQPERANREGDQALPQTTARSADVFEDAIAVLRSRQAIGTRRYGQSLQTFNGRDPHRDEFEEFIDGFIYRHQTRMQYARLEAELADALAQFARVVAERDAARHNLEAARAEAQAETRARWQLSQELEAERSKRAR